MEVYVGLWSLCPRLGLNLVYSAGNEERRLDNEVENKDKEEPMQMYWNVHPSLWASILNGMDNLQEKPSVLPQCCIHFWSNTKSWGRKSSGDPRTTHTKLS